MSNSSCTPNKRTYITKKWQIILFELNLKTRPFHKIIKITSDKDPNTTPIGKISNVECKCDCENWICTEYSTVRRIPTFPYIINSAPNDFSIDNSIFELLMSKSQKFIEAFSLFTLSNQFWVQDNCCFVRPWKSVKVILGF